MHQGKKAIRKALNRIGEDNLRDLLKVQLADGEAQAPQFFNDRKERVRQNIPAKRS